MIRIQSSASVGSDGIKVLMYGRSGIGKTPCCATAPGVIIGSAESGLLSLRRANPPVPFVEIRNRAELYEFYNWVAKSVEARQFYTICLDSLSEIIEVVLEDEKKKTKDPRKAYGEIITQGVEIARAFRDLPGKSVVVVCKEEFAKDESTGAMLFQPALPGSKLGPALPYFFDEVFHMEVFPTAPGQAPLKAFRTRINFQVVAKDRSGVLDEFEPTNLTHIFSKILGV